MLKTVLEIEIPRKVFDEMFPDDLCVLTNTYRRHEQFWGYSYSSKEDKSVDLWHLAEHTDNYKTQQQLFDDYSMYQDIIHGRGKTPFVNFVERL